MKWFRRDPIDQELQAHFEMLRQERLEAGDTPEQAERFARLRLGSRPAAREAVLDEGGWHRLESLARHLRLALRSYARNGGAYILATAILSLGIGLSVALFSVVDAVVLTPLPVPGEERVHLIWKTDPAQQAHLVGEMAYVELGDLQNMVPEIESVALFPAAPYGNGRTVQPDTGDPVQVESCPATPDFFRVLGVKPMRGRGFDARESAPGAAPVVVLSDWAWRRYFGARPDVLNQTIRVNGRGHEVIGIMPPEFDFPRGVGLWVNLPVSANRGMTWLQAVARSRPGVGADALRNSTDRAFRLQVQNHSKEYSPAQRAVVTPIREFFVGSSKPQLLLSLAASVLLLLSACASAANLFVSRTIARRHEIATRAALGASHGQILMQFAAEAVVASVFAVFAGGTLAAAVLRVLVDWAPPDIPRLENAALNTNAFAVSVAAALLSTFACVVGPVVLLRRQMLAGAAGGGIRLAGSRSGTRLQRTFVLLQAALTVTVLVASAMVFSSYRALLATDLGFSSRDALTVNLALRGPDMNPERYRRTYLDLIDTLRSKPGVTHAAGILLRPLEGPIGWDTAYSFEFEDALRDPTAVLPKANFEVVTPGYFETAGMALQSGRDFTPHDTGETEKVVIVSRSIARRFERAGRHPVGERMMVFDEVRRVIGTVADVRFRGVRQAGEDVYVPHTQVDTPTNYLIVRGNLPAGELASLVRETVRAVAPGQAIAAEATFGELADRNTARDRFHLMLLLVFAAGALLLAIAGVHSVTRETVSVRAKELAIRVAVGASRSRLAVETSRGILVWVAVGACVGLGLSLWMGRAAASLLYEVSHRDPLILAGSAAFVVAAAALSSFGPSWKAAGRDPRGQLLSD